MFQGLKCVLLLVALLLSPALAAAQNEDLASKKFKLLTSSFDSGSAVTLVGYADGWSASLDSNQVFLSFDEEFLMVCYAIQNANAEDKQKLWERAFALLENQDSIRTYRAGKSLVGDGDYREERNFAINVNYGALKEYAGYQDVARDTKEFFGIFLERLVLSYGGGTTEEIQKSEENWISFENRNPKSKWVGKLPAVLPGVADKAEKQHLRNARKVHHLQINYGYAQSFYGGSIGDFVDGASGRTLMVELRIWKFFLQTQFYNLKNEEVGVEDFAGGIASGFSLLQHKYYMADVLFGIAKTSYDFTGTKEEDDCFTPFVGVQGDFLIPISGVFDIDLRAQYLIDYSTMTSGGKKRSGIGQKLSLSAGIHLGVPMRME